MLQNGYSRWDELKHQALRAILVHELAAHQGCATCTAKALGMGAKYIYRLKREFDLPKVVARGQRCPNTGRGGRIKLAR